VCLLHPPHPHHSPIEKYVYHGEDGERLGAGANAMLMVMVMVRASTLKTSEPRATLRRGRRRFFFPTIKSFPTDRREKIRPIRVEREITGFSVVFFKSTLLMGVFSFSGCVRCVFYDIYRRQLFT